MPVKETESEIRPIERISPRKLLIAFWSFALLLVVLYSQEISSAVRLGVENEGLAEFLVVTTGVLDDFESSTGLRRAKSFLRTVRDSVHDTVVLVGGVPSSEGFVDKGPEDSLSAAGVDQPPDSISPVEIPEEPPHRILLVGSSSIQFALGRSLERSLEEYEGIEVLRFGRYSTGLARPDYFDWIEKAEELSESFSPDVVIAQVGGNDCQHLSDHQGQLVARFWTHEWDQLFSERLTEFIEIFQSGGAEVVTLGLPIVRESGFSKRASRLNSITESVSSQMGAKFVSLWEMTQSTAGEYRSELKLNGRTRSLRADDGIHLSLYGSNYVAGLISEIMKERFGLVVKNAQALESN